MKRSEPNYELHEWLLAALEFGGDVLRVILFLGLLWAALLIWACCQAVESLARRAILRP